jgi:hypothetical protein
MRQDLKAFLFSSLFSLKTSNTICAENPGAYIASNQSILSIQKFNASLDLSF